MEIIPNLLSRVMALMKLNLEFGNGRRMIVKGTRKMLLQGHAIEKIEIQVGIAPPERQEVLGGIGARDKDLSFGGG